MRGWKTKESGPFERVFDVRRSFPRFPCVKICPKIYVYSHILSSSLNIVHVFVPTANRQFIAFLYHTTRVHAFFYIFFLTTNRQPRIVSFVRSFVHRRKVRFEESRTTNDNLQIWIKLRKHYREIYGGVSRKPRRRNTKASFYSRDSNPVLILIPFTTLNRVRLWAESYVLPVRRPFNFGFPIFRKTRETRTFRKLRDKFSMNFKNRPGVSRCVRINVFLTWLDTTWWINSFLGILIS